MVENAIEWYPVTWSELRDSGVVRECYLHYCTHKYHKHIEYYKKYSLLNREKISNRMRIWREYRKEYIRDCNKEYRARNSEKISEQKKKHYSEHVKENTDRHRSYVQRNREHIREYEKEYRKSDEFRRYRREYYQSNKDKINSRRREARARKKAERLAQG